MKEENSDDERAFLLLNRIVGIVKEYAPMENVLKISMELPKDYPAKRLAAYFRDMGIVLSSKASKAGMIKVINIELKE